MTQFHVVCSGAAVDPNGSAPPQVPDRLAICAARSQPADQPGDGALNRTTSFGHTRSRFGRTVNDEDMMAPMKPRGWLQPLLLLLTCSSVIRAQEKTLAGRWSASTLKTTYGVESWGDACGPRPMGESSPGGIVTIAVSGSELSISGLGRNYSTATCWESIPGQRVTSHGASKRAWRTTCQSAPGDSRRVMVATSLSATDDQIQFSETGQFEFAIEAQTCRATMTRSRTFALVEREGESRPSPEPEVAAPSTPVDAPAVASTQPKPEPRTGSVCENPGPAARLEVRPARKLLRAGDEFAFRVAVLDRSGCVLDRLPIWRLVDPQSRLEVSPAGLVKVPKDAPEGTAVLAASVQDRSVQVTVDVVSESRYRELLSEGSFDDRGETQESAVATIATSDVGAKSSTQDETARTRRLVFALAIGAMAICLAAAAFWMASAKRRRRQAPARDSGFLPQDMDMAVCPTCQQKYPAEMRFCEVDGSPLVPLTRTTSSEPGLGKVCQICGQVFAAEVAVCPDHGHTLVPEEPPAAKVGGTPAPARRICPVCGTIYGTENQFCGNDGAALVPIN